jgi:hypothetical protein
MAKVIEVVSSMTVKVNVGDYQSVDFFTSLKAEDVQDATKTAAMLQRQLNAITLAKLRAHFKARGKVRDDNSICRMYGLQIPKP